MNIKMFHSLTRILSSRSNYNAIVIRAYSQFTAYNRKVQFDNQVEFLKSIDDGNGHNQDWTEVKNSIMSIKGNLNEKNIDAVLLKILVSSKKFVAAASFADHLKNKNEELSLGAINGILILYSKMGEATKISKEQKKFILDTHKSLYEKYKVLDSSTSENLLHVLCVIKEWEKAIKILDDIHLSAVPTHSAYSTVIATLFSLNKKKKAMELIQQSIDHRRPLQDNAYDEWIKYILRKYKDKKTISKYFDEIFVHLAANCASITEKTVNKIKDVYTSLEWDATFSRIRKSDGQCSCCKETLKCLSLSNEEFTQLQQIVKDKLIVGSDLLLKSSTDELKRFTDTVQRFAPFDVVLDGLNICYAVANGPHIQKLRLLNDVVDYFTKENKKILLLGRKHMLKWNKKFIEKIMSKTCYFFTDNLSQDDPFFITAAIMSGPKTDIVSKDLLRGHLFNLKDQNLKLLFRRWQWQHQWMVFHEGHKGANIQPPLKFTPCAQKTNNTWHIPYQSDATTSSGFVNDGTPDLRSWICLGQK
ncbi:mitochondrial ribonuclease P catalytic subunit [Anticarsia gemmatalis]|uniref:mitochondrial ribonuclease P catalytic subunit n=1 Tax=Anticarsia gemmatalis TaxID=129554 RepID=UPI003F75AAF4